MSLNNMSSEHASIDALACTEEMIHQQIISLPSARAKRNFFLPVSRLPPETLATIFIHGACEYYESDSGGRFTSCVPTWVNVSYVCSHWRNVALSCPILWTYHFTTSLRWTEELLLRSREASLKISCFYPSRRFKKVSLWPNLMDKLLKHSERIQELCLNVPLSFLPANLSLCAPRLEKLEIRLRWGIQKQPIAIIDGEKLPLHTLKLVDCSLPWYSLNLSGLKTLSLRNVRSPSPPNIVEFLSILRTMQHLTVLHLVHALPSSREFLSSGGVDSPKIDLSRLTSLAIAAPLSTVVALLSCVNIPLKTQLDLEPLVEPGSSVDDYAPISSFFVQQLSRQSSDSKPRSLILDAGYAPSLTFRLESEPFSFVHEAGDGLKITFGSVSYGDSMELMESDAFRIMSNICHSLSLTNIQSLHVIWPQFSSDIFMEILGCLHGLQRMRLSYGCMPDLSMLSLAAPEPIEDPDGQHISGQEVSRRHMFVPELEELELYRLRFTDHASFPGGMSQQSLFNTLSTRKRLQDRVIITECRDR